MYSSHYETNVVYESNIEFRKKDIKIFVPTFHRKFLQSFCSNLQIASEENVNKMRKQIVVYFRNQSDTIVL